ncbi:unnamed protein product [Prorocentrum cordatum]|uniref:CCHC-type domain-containing protein n=1 Tax=Prorocentrum cordatum TaxID=2364126 RepID=A0ABN9SFE7_9DINO|nr:unnamed protein product [Polarella glacialis]
MAARSRSLGLFCSFCGNHDHIGKDCAALDMAESLTDALGLPESSRRPSRQYQDLRKLVFDKDEVPLTIRNVAYGVPPGFEPDLAWEDPRFKDARIACNAGMMRRCKALCTAKTRSALTENPGEYIPYVMRSQARRNFQKIAPLVPMDADTYNFNVFLTWPTRNSPYTMKKDAPPDMISKVAASMVDDGQAIIEAQEGSQEAALLPAAPIRALARSPGPAAPGPATAAAQDAAAAGAVSITLGDLQNYSFTKLHDARQPKSLDWALEDTDVTSDDTQEPRNKFKAYHTALKALAPKSTGGRTKTPGRANQQASAAFKKAVETMGAKFDATRLTDVVKLVAAVRARSDELGQ